MLSQRGGTGLSRCPRHVAGQPCGTPAGSRATVRRRGRRRPTGSGKTTTLFTCLGAAQHAGPAADDDRGSRRVPRGRARPGRGEPARRAYVRERTAHDPALRPRRAAGRRDPRRGDGADRVPRGDDRPPDPDDAPRADGRSGDPAPDRHEHRAQHPRDVDQLHRRPAARAQVCKACCVPGEPDHELLQSPRDRGRRPRGRRASCVPSAAANAAASATAAGRPSSR